MSISPLEKPENLNDEKVAQLKALFPQAFSEGKLNLDALKEELGDLVDELPEGEEHYGLNWPGKRDAKKLATLPPTGTLKPMPGEGVNEDATKNLIIEGDNLEVLRIMQKAYAGRIKMIYIDPPYNTGNDFVYKDDFKEPVESYLRKSGQADEEGLLTANPKASGRFHSNWLNMMYPRLRLARNLLKDDGVIFVSIDDNEVNNLRALLDEVYGEENFVCQIIVESNKRGQTYKDISKTHEYLLCFSKTELATVNELEKEGDSQRYEDDISGFDIRELRNRNPKFGRFNRPNLFYPIYTSKAVGNEDGFHAVSLERSSDFSIEVLPLNSEGQESCWRWGKKKFEDNISIDVDKSNVIAKQKRDGGWNVYEKYRKTTYKAKSIWTETEVINEQGTIDLRELGLGGIFDFPKPVAMIRKNILLGMDDGDIFLDFYVGSGTSVQALFTLIAEDGKERQFICVQLPEKTPLDSKAHEMGYETIAEITKERARRAHERAKASGAESDLGFHVLKLDQSHFRKWTDFEGTDPQALGQLFESLETPFVDGWTPEGVLTEVMLLEGFPLDSDVSQAEDFPRTVTRIKHPEIDLTLLLCLDEKLGENIVDKLEGLENTVFICRESALDDSLKLQLRDIITVKTL